MKQEYKKEDGTIYMTNEFFDLSEDFDELDNLDQENQDEEDEDEDENEEVLPVSIIWNFVEDLEDEDIKEINDELEKLDLKYREELRKKINRNFNRLIKHTAQERYNIVMNMIEDFKESEENSFNYDADEENFDNLEFDTEDTADDEEENEIPALRNNVLDDDVKSFTYALDQELKHSEPDRNHFYLILKNDPDTEYEVSVIAKQSNNPLRYIFNIFSPIETLRSILISDIDLENTMVDSDSIW